MLWGMSENLLPRIPGQYIARALHTLPHAETAADEVMEAAIDVPGIGTVRIASKTRAVIPQRHYLARREMGLLILR